MPPEPPRVVVITGSGRGIGFATALTFGRAGYTVVVNGRDPERLQAAAGELAAAGVKAVPIAADVRHWDAVAALAAQVADSCGRVDVLINNAGGNFACPLEEISVKGWHAVLDANLTSAFFCAKAFFSSLKASHGSIINIVSVAGLGPHPERSHYAAAKAGLINLTQGMAAEWGKYGIRANAVAPGAILTPASRYADPAVRAGAEARTPLGRMGWPEEVASVCLYLASEQAGYVSGSVVRVDGGPRPIL